MPGRNHLHRCSASPWWPAGEHHGLPDGVKQCWLLLRSALAGCLLCLLLASGVGPNAAAAATPDPDPAALQAGAQLFEAHCVGCHIGGGNIIRRGRTLRLEALQRAGLADPEAIARVAAEGVGQMSGYGAALGEHGPRLVADWVWLQARAGWPRPPRLEPLPEG